MVQVTVPFFFIIIFGLFECFLYPFNIIRRCLCGPNRNEQAREDFREQCRQLNRSL